MSKFSVYVDKTLGSFLRFSWPRNFKIIFLLW